MKEDEGTKGERIIKVDLKDSILRFKEIRVCKMTASI